MNTIEGVVEIIRVGRNVAIQMADGSWYGAGFDATKLPFKEGNTIRFGYIEKGVYKNIDMKTIEIMDATETNNMSAPAPTASAPRAPAPVRQTIAAGRDDYWKNKEKEDLVKSKEIRYLACLSRATATVDLLIQHGALSLGTATKKKVDTIDAAIADYTSKYYLESAEARQGSFDVVNDEQGKEPQYE